MSHQHYRVSPVSEICWFVDGGRWHDLTPILIENHKLWTGWACHVGWDHTYDQIAATAEGILLHAMGFRRPKGKSKWLTLVQILATCFAEIDRPVSLPRLELACPAYCYTHRLTPARKRCPLLTFGWDGAAG